MITGCLQPIGITVKGAKTMIACGKCIVCKRTRQKGWAFRLRQEYKVSHSALFVTLTYADENLIWADHEIQPGVINSFPILYKKHVTEFLKKLRQKQDRYEKKFSLDKHKIRFFCAGEYGARTFRPHYHLILFNVRKIVSKDISEIWGHGSVHMGTVTPKSITYCTKYMLKDEGKMFYHPSFPQYTEMSTRPGLGQSYYEKNWRYHVKNQTFITYSDGVKQVIPRFYRDKIFGIKSKERIGKQMEKELWEKEDRLFADLTKKGMNPAEQELQSLEAFLRQHEKHQLHVKNKSKL